jgi:hypothetical protein
MGSDACDGAAALPAFASHRQLCGHARVLALFVLQPLPAGDGFRLGSGPALVNVRVVASLKAVEDVDPTRLSIVLHDGSAGATATYFVDADDVHWANTRATLR